MGTKWFKLFQVETDESTPSNEYEFYEKRSAWPQITNYLNKIKHRKQPRKQ